jgi:hypothetical protein
MKEAALDEDISETRGCSSHWAGAAAGQRHREIARFAHGANYIGHEFRVCKGRAVQTVRRPQYALTSELATVEACGSEEASVCGGSPLGQALRAEVVGRCNGLPTPYFASHSVTQARADENDRVTGRARHGELQT